MGEAQDSITITVGPHTLTLERETGAEGSVGYLVELGEGVVVAALHSGGAWRVAVLLVDRGRAHAARSVGHARRSTVQAAAVALPSEAVEAVVLARAA